MNTRKQQKYVFVAVSCTWLCVLLVGVCILVVNDHFEKLPKIYYEEYKNVLKTQKINEKRNLYAEELNRSYIAYLNGTITIDEYKEDCQDIYQKRLLLYGLIQYLRSTYQVVDVAFMDAVRFSSDQKQDLLYKEQYQKELARDKEEAKQNFFIEKYGMAHQTLILTYEDMDQVEK